MSSNTNEVCCYFSSANRSSGTVNDYIINYKNDRFLLPPKYVKVISANIPYTWYNIVTGTNDQIVFVESTGPTTYTVTVPSGNYDGSSLATAVAYAMNNTGAADTYTVKFDSSKLVFNITSTGTFYFNFLAANNMAKLLGFPAQVYPLAPTNDLTSVTVADLLPDTSLIICSNLVEGIDNGVPLITDGDAVSNNVMAVINIVGSYGQTLTYDDYGTGIPLMNVSQSALGLRTGVTVPIRFYLRFPDGFPLNLNGVGWSVVVKFVF